MKVIWYLPSMWELFRGAVFGGELRVLKMDGVWGVPFMTVQDTKKFYNLCRIEYEPGEFTSEELRTIGENYKMLAEIKLDEIRNGHEPTV